MSDEMFDESTLDYTLLDQQLGKAKASLCFMRGAGFLGSLVCNHTFKWTTKVGPECTAQISTAACDGDTIWINPFFWEKLNKGQRIFLLYHEIWHTGYDHMGRLGERCPKLWNQAADYVINNQADHDGYELQNLPIDICLDHKFDGMTTEEIYDTLEKNPGSGGSLQGNGSYNPPGGGSMQGDVHPNTNPNPKAVMQKVIQAKQISQFSKEAGIIPGEMEEAIEEFLNPVLPWPVILTRFFTAMDNSDYSWRRPSRRCDEEYLPSLYSDNGLEHLIWGWDVSGSMSHEELIRVNSETKHIHDEIEPKLMTVVTFDTKIHDIFDFTDEEAFEKIVVHGRGGTDMRELFDYAKEQQPTALVVFSDMYCDLQMEDPGCPVIWVGIDNEAAREQVPFGTYFNIPRDKI